MQCFPFANLLLIIGHCKSASQLNANSTSMPVNSTSELPSTTRHINNLYALPL